MEEYEQVKALVYKKVIKDTRKFLSVSTLWPKWLMRHEG